MHTPETKRFENKTLFSVSQFMIIVRTCNWALYRDLLVTAKARWTVIHYCTDCTEWTLRTPQLGGLKTIFRIALSRRPNSRVTTVDFTVHIRLSSGKCPHHMKLPLHTTTQQFTIWNSLNCTNCVTCVTSITHFLFSHIWAAAVLAQIAVSSPMLQVLQAMLQVLQAELHKLCRILRAEQSPGQQGELPDCLLQHNRLD